MFLNKFGTKLDSFPISLLFGTLENFMGHNSELCTIQLYNDNYGKCITFFAAIKLCSHGDMGIP